MRTVYIVDDEHLILEQFLKRRSLFLENGFDICGESINPFEALEQIRSLKPDVVISDLKMPGLSGTELLEKLNEDSDCPQFVIASAYNEFENVRRLFLSHGFDYLVKPVSDRELTELLNRVTDSISDSEPDIKKQPSSRKFDAVLRYLKENPTINHTLETVSKYFKFNGNYLCNLFSKHSDMTFSRYLNVMRAERAAELLHTTDKPIKEVAASVGYNDYYYFCRVFKKIYGISPSQYRFPFAKNEQTINKK
ncbi:MAG: helix-turn-helix domain-containing protein [Oscillospiraceae bacterium]|nr:helix-turn-helix domain-containing protein [Oscillospiraceae bacterium]